jgi:hypothetical protein
MACQRGLASQPAHRVQRLGAGGKLAPRIHTAQPQGLDQLQTKVDQKVFECEPRALENHPSARLPRHQAGEGPALRQSRDPGSPLRRASQKRWERSTQVLQRDGSP